MDLTAGGAVADLQWARLKTAAGVPLRRGAWYRVAALTPLEAVVTVDDKSIVVPRLWVELRSALPREWTVLRSPPLSSRTPESFRRGYLVCPGCGHRVGLPLTLHTATQLCLGCSDTFSIAWKEHYWEKGDAPGAQ